MTEPLEGYHHSPEENVALDWLITFSIFALPAFIIPGVYFYFSFPSAKKFYEKEVSKEVFSSRQLTRPFSFKSYAILAWSAQFLSFFLSVFWSILHHYDQSEGCPSLNASNASNPLPSVRYAISTHFPEKWFFAASIFFYANQRMFQGNMSYYSLLRLILSHVTTKSRKTYLLSWNTLLFYLNFTETILLTSLTFGLSAHWADRVILVWCLIQQLKSLYMICLQSNVGKNTKLISSSLLMAHLIVTSFCSLLEYVIILSNLLFDCCQYLDWPKSIWVSLPTMRNEILPPMPAILRQVLETSGWKPFNRKKIQDFTNTKQIEQIENGTEQQKIENDEIEEGTQLLIWRGSRPSRKELSVANQWEEYFNHFPETYTITSKGHLQYFLKLSAMKFGNKIFDFFPRSWILTKQSNRIILPYEDKRNEQMNIAPIWIGKPSNKSRGRGIKITKSLHELAEYVTDKEDEMTDDLQAGLTERKPGSYYLLVVQEYIPNPYLINNYKFDIRLYAVVSSMDPLKMFLYSDGLVRFCTKTYSLDDFDRLRHLTNSSIQDKLLNGEGLTDIEKNTFVETISAVLPPIGSGDFSKRDFRTFLSYMKGQGVNIEELWIKIQNVVILTMLTVYSKEKVNSNKNCFELLGFDQLEAKLVEVNLGPSLGITSEVDVYVKQPLCCDMLEIVNTLVMNKGVETKSTRKSILAPLTENKYTQDKGIGDFEQIFPFNKEVEELSKTLSNPNVTDKDECMQQIINHVSARLDKFKVNTE